MIIHKFETDEKEIEDDMAYAYTVVEYEVNGRKLSVDVRIKVDDGCIEVDIFDRHMYPDSIAATRVDTGDLYTEAEAEEEDNR